MMIHTDKTRTLDGFKDVIVKTLDNRDIKSLFYNKTSVVALLEAL